MSKLFCIHNRKYYSEIRLKRYKCADCGKVFYKRIIEQEEDISNKKAAKLLKEFEGVEDE